MGQGTGPGSIWFRVMDDVATLDPTDPDKLAYVTQTTLSVDDTRGIVDALKARFPTIRGPGVDDICYATQNRQTAGTAARGPRRRDPGRRRRPQARTRTACARSAKRPESTATLIADAGRLEPGWLDGVRTVGITGGASTPEELVQGLVDRLGGMFDIAVRELDGVEETMTFKLPRELLGTGDRTA